MSEVFQQVAADIAHIYRQAQGIRSVQALSRVSNNSEYDLLISGFVNPERYRAIKILSEFLVDAKEQKELQVILDLARKRVLADGFPVYLELGTEQGDEQQACDLLVLDNIGPYGNVTGKRFQAMINQFATTPNSLHILLSTEDQMLLNGVEEKVYIDFGCRFGEERLPNFSLNLQYSDHIECFTGPKPVGQITQMDYRIARYYASMFNNLPILGRRAN